MSAAPHQPQVSVIISTYNSAATLASALASVLDQDFVGYEVLVAGDGCTDSSAAVVESVRDSRVHWFNLARNSGTPGKPRNEAIRRARGRYLAYLGHDDLWLPDHLSTLFKLLEGSQNEFAHGKGAAYSLQGLLCGFALPADPHDPKNFLCPSNWMHTKDLAARIGGWSERIRVGLDRDFLHRIYGNHARITSTAKATAIIFPSAYWQLYRRDTLHPQPVWLKAIREDAQAVRKRVDHDLLTGIDRCALAPNTPKSLWRKLVKHLMNWYGRERWPLATVIAGRGRQRRGLPFLVSRFRNNPNGHE